MLFEIPRYVLPAPLEVARAALQERQSLLSATAITGLGVLCGFIAGNLAGLLVAVSVAFSVTASRTVLPMALALRCIPIIALTPFLTLLLGRGLATVTACAALIVFFPTLINGVLGLRSAEREALELMRSLNASARQTFWRVRLPTAMPHLFAAFRVAAASSVLGVMIAEWVTSDRGLGYLILQSGVGFKVELMWAAILVSTAMVGVAFALVSVAERVLCPWIRETI
jgi:NitT/TauT family transport system permease protein